MTLHRLHPLLAAIPTAALLLAIQSCDPSHPTDIDDTPASIDTTTIDSSAVLAGVVLNGCGFPLYPVNGIEIQLRLSDTTITRFTNSHGEFRFDLRVPQACQIVIAAHVTVILIQSQILPKDSLWFELRTVSPRASIAPGVLLVGPADTVQFRTLTDVIQTLGLRVYSVSNWEFVTPHVSLDSARNIQSMLAQKAYIPDWRLTITENGDSSRVKVSGFQSLDSAAIENWFELHNQVGMIELSSVGRWVEIRSVPLRHECEWTAILSQTGIVQYVNLNYLGSGS